MQKLDVSGIKDWPDDVLAAYCDINEEIDPNVLSQKQRKKYDSFTNEKRKIEFLLGRSLLNQLLIEIKIDPSSVEVCREEKGKPYAVVDGTILQLSFSHSAQIVMCALSQKYRIGIDIESADRKINKKTIGRILSEKEWKVIGYENPIKLWTIKEAALKCSGVGLQSNIKDLKITKRNNNSCLLRFNNEIKYEICSFRTIDHQIALAYQSIHS